MDLLWPQLLILLGLIPLLIVAYVWNLLRRRRFSMRFSSLALLQPALPRYSWLRRHLPFALFLAGMLALITALARPEAVVAVPVEKAAIILAIDVSGSMRSTDVQPSRIEAAKAAALDFVKSQGVTTQIGIVAFSGYAEIVQPPTTDHDALSAAIARLYTMRSTAIGSGILRSIDAIAEVDNDIAPLANEAAPGVAPAPVPKGSYASDIIILLTDGVSNTGPLPLDAAQQAVDRGIRVFTIGFGTANGSIPDQFGGPFGGGRFGGRFRAGIDEATLQKIADLTGGRYSRAASAAELQQVYHGLQTVTFKNERTEITVAFTALGALLSVLAILLSTNWNPLP